MKSLIVVAEDDLLVSMVVEDILTEHGYSIVTVASADQAMVEIERRESIAALVTDIDMPGKLNGLDLAAAVAISRPDLPVIVASGKHRPLASELGSAHFLAKPFLVEELVSTVDALIAERSPDAL